MLEFPKAHVEPCDGGIVRFLVNLAKRPAMDQKTAPAPAPAPAATAIQKLSAEQQHKIIAELDARKVNKACPRCNNANFTLSDQITKVAVQGLDASIILGGATMPCAITFCVNCGFVSLHALGALGFLNPNGGFEKI